MAKTSVKVFRTTTTGNLPNTTNIANTKFIDFGELALNGADFKMHSSNGSFLFEIGANVINQNVTGKLSLSGPFGDGTGSNGVSGYLLSSNGTSTIWVAPPSGSFSNGTAYTWSAVQSFNSNIVVTGISANGSFGTAAQVLTSNGTSTYWAAGGGGGGGVTFIPVEINVGSTPKYSGKFSLTGLSGLTIGKPVLMQQAVGPYTNKGTLADEAEMDQLSISASVTAANTIVAYWASARRVRGNFKFNYLVGA